MREQHRLGRPLPQRIAILRALKLGDLLCALPAFRALRAALPQAEITLIGLPWARSFVERFEQYLDGFIELPGYPGLPERTPQLAEIPGFLARVQQRRLDLAIQMHGSGSITNSLTVLLGARLNAGYFLPGEYCPDEERFLPYPHAGLEIRRHLRLMDFLGIHAQGEHLEFPLVPDDFRALAAMEDAVGLRQAHYVCVHPGAGSPARRWPPERFAAVADALAARGLRVVLTGTAAEVELAEVVARAMNARALNLVGRTNLGTLGALLAGARLLVSNDTGVSHIAAALRVPSVIISTGNNPDHWAPPDRQRHRVLCPASEVMPQAVIAQAADVLGAEGSHAA